MNHVPQFCPQCRAPLLTRQIDAVERLACSAPDCSFVHWNNPTPVVAAFVRKGEHYVLARNVAWAEGVFSMITGFLEAGEHPESAIQREIQEELGLNTTHLQFLGHYVMPKFNQLLLVYLAKAAGDIQLNAELVEYRQFTRDALLTHDFGRLKLIAELAQLVCDYHD